MDNNQITAAPVAVEQVWYGVRRLDKPEQAMLVYADRKEAETRAAYIGYEYPSFGPHDVVVLVQQP